VRIVLSRLDRVGDLILSTPAIASVRRSWPQAHVTLACSRHNHVVVEHSPDLDEVVVVEPHESPSCVGRRLAGAELAIALAPCAADFRLVRATGAAARVGYTYARRYLARLTAPLFLTALELSQADPARSESEASVPVRHEVDQVLALVTRAGGAVLARELVVPVSAADRASVAHVPGGALTLHLGARWFRDGSTLASAIALMRDLRARGHTVVATYGPDADAEAREVREAGAADAVIGGLSFPSWAAVFEKSRLILTVDTGATHVASAMKRPTVVLFEHRYFALASREWAPYRVPQVSVRKPATQHQDDLAASRVALLHAVETLVADA